MDVQLDLGDKVTHKHFGEGRISQRRGAGDNLEFFVDFCKVHIWVLPDSLTLVKRAERATAKAA